MSDSYKLSDIYELQMGKTPSRDISDYWADGQYDWISIADLSKCEKYINQTKERITNRAIEESGIKVIPTDTIIMSFKLSIGKVAITQRPVYSNEAIMAFIDKGVTYILPQYAFYLFSAQKWDKGTNRAVMGATLNKATLSQYRVSIHNADEQAEIVNRLNKITDLINFRRKQIQKIDDLVKSQFIEMFGTIPKDRYAPLDRVCKIITDGTHQPPQFSNSGIPFLFVSNLANNEINYQTQKFISKDTYKELIKRTPIQIGDVLLSTVGSYGHPAVVTDDREFCFQRHIAYFKPNPQMIDSRFLYGALLSPIGQEQIERAVKGIAQKTLNLSEIRKIRIPLPSYEHQKQYSAFYEQTDKSKVLIREHLFLINRLRKVEKT